MTLSVRLDEKTKRRLSRYARERRVSQSEVVRRALSAYLEEVPAGDGMSLYDRMKDIIGSVRGGPPDLSENTGEKFRQILLEKKRQGRF
jgi:Arc/MetJ-type ribon-helix-helix transcriptional regulator